jgi:hypothetical protein
MGWHDQRLAVGVRGESEHGTDWVGFVAFLLCVAYAWLPRWTIPLSRTRSISFCESGGMTSFQLRALSFLAEVLGRVALTPLPTLSPC